MSAKFLFCLRWDEDGSGFINFEELCHMLHKQDIELDNRTTFNFFFSIKKQIVIIFQKSEKTQVKIMHTTSWK
jgi:hypothetical protein